MPGKAARTARQRRHSEGDRIVALSRITANRHLLGAHRRALTFPPIK